MAGGTGSEAGDAYGVARSIGGENPAAFARVSLYHSADSLFTHPQPYADTFADSLGRYHFRIRKSGKYDLEIRSHSGDGIRFRACIQLAAPGETDIGGDVLTEPAYFRDRLPARPVSPTRIWLAGTPYSAEVDSLGSFVFGILPKGEFMMFSERSAGDTLERIVLGNVILLPGDSLAPPDTVKIPPADTGKPIVIIPSDTVASDTLAPGQFMIEDFNDSDAVSNYGRLNGKLKWIPCSVELASMRPFSSATFGSFQTAAKAYRGKSLEVEYTTLRQDLGKSMVELPMAPLNPNLRTADTLVFYAKGSGSLQAEIELEFMATVVEGSSFGLDNIILTGTTFKTGDAR